MVILATVTLCAQSSVALADSPSQQEEAYAWLLQHGTPASLLDNRSGPALTALYDRLSSYDQLKTKADNEVDFDNPPPHADNDYLLLNISAYRGLDSEGYLEELTVAIDWRWRANRPF